MVDLHLEHVVVELHGQPVVLEAVTVLRAAHLDAGVLRFAHRPHAPRTVARALPHVGGDVERAPGRADGAFPHPDLRVACDVLDDAAVPADERTRLFERVDGAGEREVGADAPFVVVAADAQRAQALEDLDRERADRGVHAVDAQLA